MSASHFTARTCARKSSVEAHRHAAFLPLLSPLLSGATKLWRLSAPHSSHSNPSSTGLTGPARGLGTGGTTPHIKAAPPCDELHACPDCVAGQPCPKDTIYQLLTRRTLDYGLTSRGEPVSLFSRRVKDDLWDQGNDRKMNTWPAQGMHDMAAHMMWMLIAEARRKNNTTRGMDIIAKAVARNLHEHDPRLALEVARYWSQQPRKEQDITRLVEVMRAKATTDPGYLDLDVWYEGSHRKKLCRPGRRQGPQGTPRIQRAHGSARGAPPRPPAFPVAPATSNAGSRTNDNRTNHSRTNHSRTNGTQTAAAAHVARASASSGTSCWTPARSPTKATTAATAMMIASTRSTDWIP